MNELDSSAVSCSFYVRVWIFVNEKNWLLVSFKYLTGFYNDSNMTAPTVFSTKVSVCLCVSLVCVCEWEEKTECQN